MEFQSVLIREQGVTFAVIVVKQFALRDVGRASELIAQFQLNLGTPVVLMCQDTRGVPTYRGRRDLVNFLCHVPLANIPWRTLSIR